MAIAATPCRRQRVCRRGDLGLIERLQHRTARIDAFRHFQAALARHQRHRRAHSVVVEMRPHLAADLQHVAKSPRDDQPGGDATALDHHVGGDRGAMTDEADLARRDAQRVQQHAKAGFDRLGRIGRRGRHLEVPQHAVGRVVQSEVGERAADVEADAIHAATVGLAVAALKSPLQWRCLSRRRRRREWVARHCASGCIRECLRRIGTSGVWYYMAWPFRGCLPDWDSLTPCLMETVNDRWLPSCWPARSGCVLRLE